MNELIDPNSDTITARNSSRNIVEGIAYLAAGGKTIVLIQRDI